MSKIEITVPDNQFECLLVAAVRYSIGRRTYMPETVTRWIAENCYHKLSQRIIEVMLRDIDTAPGLGDDCDVTTWSDFRAWLKMQEREMYGES